MAKPHLIGVSMLVYPAVAFLAHLALVGLAASAIMILLLLIKGLLTIERARAGRPPIQ